MQVAQSIRLLFFLCAVIAFGALALPSSAATGDPTPGGGGGGTPPPSGGSGPPQPSIPTLFSQALAATSENPADASVVIGTCNPLGNSTFRFRVTGTAGGSMFKGRFVETGTFTIGPRTAQPDGNVIATPLSFNSIFTIDAPEGSVIGFKKLSAVPLEPVNFGACGELTAGFPHGVAINLRADYTALIYRGGYFGIERGTSVIRYDDIGTRVAPAGMGTFGFGEDYTPQLRGDALSGSPAGK